MAVDVIPAEGRKIVFVVGLGMVGIGMSVVPIVRACSSPCNAAFIEKLLNLDTKMKYRVVTCGEEMHRECPNPLCT